MDTKRILLKLSGTIFGRDGSQTLIRTHADALAAQIKQLHTSHQFCLVMGGGNFFRGSQHNNALKLRPTVAHTVGMLGTISNAVIMREILEQNGIAARVLCANSCDLAGDLINQQTIDRACKQQECIIFAGGAGIPYVTTDTTALVRALQIGAHQVWKATDVDGVYDADPRTHARAKILTRVSPEHIIRQQLAIMDKTAIILAQEHRVTIRVFNIFSPNALIQTAHSETFGTTICTD